jgi:hypothetical protein
MDDEPTLFLVHGSIEHLPAASAATVLLHVDEPRVCVFLGDGSSDKIDGWFLDSGATHHMTGRWEFFSDLNTNVRGSVKFGDSGVDIGGIGSAILVAKNGEYRLLTEVFYIPALRNSIISLGRLDANGSRVEIKDGVMRIWDRQQLLLANTFSTPRWSSPCALQFVATTKLGGGTSALGIFTSRLCGSSTPRGWCEVCRMWTMSSSSATCVLTKQKRLSFPRQANF